MKRFALIVTLLMLFQSAAFAIGPTYSGSWFNPEQNGHGFSLEYSVLSDGTPLVVVYWYVYDQDGNPIFLVGLGEPEAGNSVTLEFEAPHGMKFGEFDPDSTVREDGGMGVFTFQNEESGTFNYEPSAWIADAYGLSAISIPVKMLLEVAHPNDEPPSGEPVPITGQWTGRMTYNRNSAGGSACYDANVQAVVQIMGNKDYTYVRGITVSPDVGGLYIDSGLNGPVSDEGYVTGNIYEVDGQSIDFTIAFNTRGNAEGIWTYVNSDCYGEWTFTKD